MQTPNLMFGLGNQDAALLVLRLCLGLFFVLARFRWAFDPSRPEDPWFNQLRREHLSWKLCTCGYSKRLVLSCFVACVEISAGIGVVMGLLTVLSAFGLLSILLPATFCTAKTKVLEQHPVDAVDCVSCYLWRVEGVYIAIAVCVMLLGPGAYSLDAWVFG